MKVGIMSDLHLGSRQYGLEERENDFYIQYNAAIDGFIKNKVNLVIIGGDLFDQPRPSPKALEAFTNGMKKLFSHNIKVLNVIGNHSMIQSKGFVTADQFLASMPGFQDHYMLLDSDMDNIHYFTHNDVEVFGLPYHYNFELDEFIQKVKVLNDKAKKSSSDMKILVIHQAIKEFCGFQGEKLSIDDMDIDGFNLIICGHIHDTKLISVNQTVFLQPGSIERMSVKEARDEELYGKGIFVFDTDEFNIDNISNGFIALKSKRKFLIADMYIKDSSEIEDVKNELLSEVKKCVIAPIMFLTVHDVSGSFTHLIDLTKDLKLDCLTVNFNYIDESIQKEVELFEKSGESPTPRGALKLALNPLDEEEANLGLDLYDLLKDGKDAKDLLDKFIQKRKKRHKEERERDYYDEELEEIIKYFEEK